MDVNSLKTAERHQKRRIENKEDYRWYKQRGICVRCRKDRAMNGAVRCPACADKQAERDKALYMKHKANPEYRQKLNARSQQLRDRRREAGKCRDCGKRPAKEGYVRCMDCLIAARRRKGRHNNDIKRHERPSYGLCYICAKTVKPGYKLCEECYGRITGIGAHYAKNPTPAMLERKEYIKRLNCLTFRMQPDEAACMSADATGGITR